ncbi:MAG: CPBP family intramembrane metalloprotease [Candidatus Omnitrophica bacterium]|nr:CPBP family intramembrane metalloprotease [Candidatus Omnitrophota bacterium]
MERVGSPLRWFILLLLFCTPLILLSLGIYGSFLFTFSIPIFWQLFICKKPISSLGLTRIRVKPAVIAGLISAVALALLGGSLIRLIGLSGYTYTETHSLQFSFAGFNIVFPLERELGYRLLMRSDTWPGLLAYLIFSVFAIGLGEELFWRGFIQRKIAQRFSTTVSIWLTALFFASIHFYIFAVLPAKTGLIFLSMIALVGIAWGYLFERFNNIWAPAISHGVVAFVIWKYYFFTG